MKRGSVHTLLPERGRLLCAVAIAIAIASVAHNRSVLFRKGVRVVRDDDQDSTDLMKCIRSLQEKEEAEGVDVGGLHLPFTRFLGDTGIYIFLLHFTLFFCRPLTTSSYFVASLGDSIRPSTYYRIYTSSGKVDVDCSSSRTRM